METKPTIKRILAAGREYWDNGQTRSAVRENFRKAIDCRTAALGYEVFASETGERKLVPHTCKSKACPGCGWRATLCWQREVAARLPDTSFVAVGLTMPDVFWPIFQENRHLLDDLPALAAGVLEDWAKQRRGAQVPVLVVRHTFGEGLKFNPHLHMIVATVGLDRARNKLISRVCFPRDAIRHIWRDTLLDYLAMTLEASRLHSKKTPSEIRAMIEKYRTTWWNVYIKKLPSKNRYLQYMSRYMLRPPLAEYKILFSEDRVVRFWTKDTKNRCERIQEYTVSEFIRRLADQVTDRYRHGVRYFGLLAPRSAVRYEVFWRLLGQRRRLRPRRMSWAESIRQCFGRDPLLDSGGERMNWVGRISPLRLGVT